MIADVLLVLAVLMIIFGIVKKRERWGLAVMSAGIGMLVAVMLMAWTDFSDSFLSGVREGFRDAGQ